jgi:ribosomal protein S4
MVCIQGKYRYFFFSRENIWNTPKIPSSRVYRRNPKKKFRFKRLKKIKLRVHNNRVKFKVGSPTISLNCGKLWMNKLKRFFKNIMIENTKNTFLYRNVSPFQFNKIFIKMRHIATLRGFYSYLYKMLELRLDSILFLLKIGRTLPEVGKLIRYGIFCINNKLILNPGVSVKVGDLITIKPTYIAVIRIKLFKSLNDRCKKKFSIFFNSKKTNLTKGQKIIALRQKGRRSLRRLNSERVKI